MSAKRRELTCLILSLIAMLMLSAGTILAVQTSREVSHEDLANQLNSIRSQHVETLTKQAAIDEHLKDLDRQFGLLNESHVIERMVRVESTGETNQKFLLGILGALVFLVLERILSHAGAIPQKR
jgi:hypothetical protein